MYDGVKPVEHQFHLWPENITTSTATSAVTPTGNTVNGSNVITSVSVMMSVGVGCTITGIWGFCRYDYISGEWHQYYTERSCYGDKYRDNLNDYGTINRTDLFLLCDL